MYEQISIQGFRGIKELTIDKLAPINILIGNNGSGKSSVLEALWLHTYPIQPRFAAIDDFRGFAWNSGIISGPNVPWQHLFYGYEIEEPIVISGKTSEHSWKIQLRQAREGDPPPVAELSKAKSNEWATLLRSASPTRPLVLEFQGDAAIKPDVTRVVATAERGLEPIYSLIHWRGPVVNSVLLASLPSILPELAVFFGRIVQQNKQDSVLKVAQIIQPNLKSLSPIPRSDGKSYLYGDIGQKELLPIQLMGNGLVSVLTLAIVAVDMGGGLLLIDEIENGIHYSALEPLWKGIWGLCTELDIQIVATTHSLECVEAARTVLPPEAFLVHRLERNMQTGGVRVGSLDAEMLAGAADIGLEVR